MPWLRALLHARLAENAPNESPNAGAAGTIFEIRPVKLYFPGGTVSPILPPGAGG